MSLVYLFRTEYLRPLLAICLIKSSSLSTMSSTFASSFRVKAALRSTFESAFFLLFGLRGARYSVENAAARLMLRRPLITGPSSPRASNTTASSSQMILSLPGLSVFSLANVKVGAVE